MTRYEKEGLVTDDPLIAALFFDKILEKRDWEDGGWMKIHIGFVNRDTYRIHWPTVWEIIQPVEDEGYIEDFNIYTNNILLSIKAVYPKYVSNSKGYYHKRVLNIVTTRAELRELVEHARPKCT